MKIFFSFFLLFVLLFTQIDLFCVSKQLDEQKASQVDLFLKKIAKDQKPRIYLRRKTFDAASINSYLAKFYLPRYAREVKEATLIFEKDNWVSGTIKIQLNGPKYQKIPGFLKDMSLEVRGIIESRPEQMRFIINDLKLNNTSFSPEILDEAFSSFQGGNKIKRSIFDWFTLLPGIKRIGCDADTLIIFY